MKNNKNQEIKKPNINPSANEHFKNGQNTQDFNQLNENQNQGHYQQNVDPNFSSNEETKNDSNYFKKEIQKKDQQIATLTEQLESINANFKTELENRANKAQEMINKKVDEILKKSNEEVQLIKKYAIKDYGEELINIVSQINSVIASSENNPDPSIKNYVVGFKMYMNMFQNLFASMGIKPIAVKVGDVFDEKIMEAVDTEKTKDVKAGHVSKIIKEGYYLHDRVLIHCQVIVAK